VILLEIGLTMKDGPGSGVRVRTSRSDFRAEGRYALIFSEKLVKLAEIGQK
jgi:hypothetical protein